MYHTILIPLENTEADETILAHVRRLAQLAHSRLLLVHVADGWVARNFERLQLAESEEIKKDRAYLEQRAANLAGEGFETEHILAMGEPADEIIKLANERGVDLIAMSTHGHRFVGDLLFGNTADKVRHRVSMPVLLLKMQK
jgi:nucleotide-binding universal stress UspA family protein